MTAHSRMAVGERPDSRRSCGSITKPRLTDLLPLKSPEQ
jgi:hypothetical protein